MYLYEGVRVLCYGIIISVAPEPRTWNIFYHTMYEKTLLEMFDCKVSKHCGERHWSEHCRCLPMYMYRVMKCSMDNLKFTCSWRNSSIGGAKISVKVKF